MPNWEPLVVMYDNKVKSKGILYQTVVRLKIQILLHIHHF